MYVIMQNSILKKTILVTLCTGLLSACVGESASTLPSSTTTNTNMQSSAENFKPQSPTPLINTNNSSSTDFSSLAGWGKFIFADYLSNNTVFPQVNQLFNIHVDPNYTKQFGNIIDGIKELDGQFDTLEQNINTVTFKKNEIISKVDNDQKSAIRNYLNIIGVHNYSQWDLFTSTLGSSIYNLDHLVTDNNTLSKLQIAIIINNIDITKLALYSGILSNQSATAIKANNKIQLADVAPQQIKYLSAFSSAGFITQLFNADYAVLKDKLLADAKDNGGHNYNSILDNYNNTITNQMLQITNVLKKIYTMEDILLYLEYNTQSYQRSFFSSLALAEPGLNNHDYAKDQQALDTLFTSRENVLLLAQNIVSDSDGHKHLEDIITSNPDFNGKPYSTNSSNDILYNCTKLYTWSVIDKQPFSAGIKDGNTQMWCRGADGVFSTYLVYGSDVCLDKGGVGYNIYHPSALCEKYKMDYFAQFVGPVKNLSKPSPGNNQSLYIYYAPQMDGYDTGNFTGVNGGVVNTKANHGDFNCSNCWHSDGTLDSTSGHIAYSYTTNGQTSRYKVMFHQSVRQVPNESKYQSMMEAWLVCDNTHNNKCNVWDGRTSICVNGDIITLGSLARFHNDDENLQISILPKVCNNY